MTAPLQLKFFTREGCELCDSAWHVLARARAKIGSEKVSVERVDIAQNPSYLAAYGSVIPVITCNEKEIARSFVDEKVLVTALQHALR